MGGQLYRSARHTYSGLWVRQAGFMALEKWCGCRHSWINLVITDKMPKAQEVPEVHWKSLVKRQVQLTAVDRRIIESVSSGCL